MGKDNNNRKRKNLRRGREKPEFDQQLVDIARVTRVMAGGKRMRFRTCLVIGDRKGRVGYGIAKGTDVPIAIGKAYKKAEKSMIRVNIINDTIPYEVRIKQGAAKILLKPAPMGTGVIAGGACRTVLSLAGVKNVVAKIMGTNNKISNVKALVKALSELRKVESKSKNQESNKSKNQQVKKNKNNKKTAK